MALQKSGLVEWSVSSRPMRGQTVSGDLHLVEPIAGQHDRIDALLLAVIDGVGHGAEAASAAQKAALVLTDRPQDSVLTLVRRCHEALNQTRGVVMTVAAFHAAEGTMTWLGVGNVEGRLFRAGAGSSYPQETLLLRGGLVGYQLPTLSASVLQVAPGDLLVLVTDGIRSGFEAAVRPDAPLAQIASSVLDGYFKGNDDALVLVARYLGGKRE